MKNKELKILLSAPRGFCAGVERAIEIVEKSIKKYGAPVYVRHEIVHNKHVVDDLKKKVSHKSKEDLFLGIAGPPEPSGVVVKRYSYSARFWVPNLESIQLLWGSSYSDPPLNMFKHV